MNGFHSIDNGQMAYDEQRDGVWLSDNDGDPTVFLPRNVIIQALSLLPGDVPKVQP